MDQTSQTITSYPEPLDEGATVFAHRAKVFIGLAVLLSAMGYLVFMAFQSATVYYYTVGELEQRGPSEDGRLVRVNGKLAPGSFRREADSTLARFDLTDGTASISAVHQGILPGLFFNEHSEIILEGIYTRDGSFESHNVIVKCPSKYIAVN